MHRLDAVHTALINKPPEKSAAAMDLLSADFPVQPSSVGGAKN